MEIGSMRRRGFQRKGGIFRPNSSPTAIWNFCARVRFAAHGGARYPSPHPPRRSSRRADSFARGGGEGHSPPCRRSSGGKAQELLRRIKGALTLEEADAAGKTFRAWAEAEGLLLVPPADRRARLN